MNAPNTTPASVGTTDDDALIAELPDLRIEVSHSEDMVILQQGRNGEEDRIAIHRWQVRMLAEQFGLLPARTHARATVESLARRLLKLRERVDHLGEHLYVHVEDQYSLQYAMASCEIADEFVADLDSLTGGTVTAPKHSNEVL
ncbi:hypothetical protein QTI51_24645 [Variovorax sp. J22G73]|uniref:hypothetical protein n=1 Tax=unclassified Variovorax TaxID=663243 RepID=UPI00257898D1|nr:MULTISPECIES: hypothetical protein [unclassified Variovorax]MDM0007888.1 hypothetical protein [Variovorax sp. J22R203]MDM0100489.1 hypothetical protein [Variovorax sp. J22G73]